MFSGKKKENHIHLSECIWMIFQCCGWSEIFLKRDHVVAIGEKHRLRLRVIKSSTRDEGVRYFNPPVSPNAEKIHLHVLFAEVFLPLCCSQWLIFCVKVYLAAAFLSSPFGACKREKQNTSLWTWGSWIFMFWKTTHLSGWTAKIAKKHLRCVCTVAYCTSSD